MKILLFFALCAFIASPFAYARGPSKLEKNAVWELPEGGIVPRSTFNIYVYFPGHSIYHGLSADTSTADFLKSVRFYIQRPFFLPDKALHDKTPAVVSIDAKSETVNDETPASDKGDTSSNEVINDDSVVEAEESKDSDSVSLRSGIKAASAQPAVAASLVSASSSGEILDGIANANDDREDTGLFVAGSPEQDYEDFVNHINGLASKEAESPEQSPQSSKNVLDVSEPHAEASISDLSDDSGVDVSADQAPTSPTSSEIELQKIAALEVKHPVPVEQIELKPGEYRIAKVDLTQGVTEDNYIVPATEFYHLKTNVPEAFADVETNMIYQVRLNVPDSFRHWMSKKMKFVIRSQRGFWIFKKKFAVSPAFPIVAALPSVDNEAERKACEALCLEGVFLNQCKTHGIFECRPDQSLVLPDGVVAGPPLTAAQKKIKNLLGQLNRDDFLELYKRIMLPKSTLAFQRMVDPLLVLQVYRQKFSKHAPKSE